MGNAELKTTTNTDNRLAELLAWLESTAFNLKIRHLVHGSQPEILFEGITTIERITDEIYAHLGGHPASTGSRRSDVRNDADPGLLRGDPRTTCELGSSGRPGAAAGADVGNKSPRSGSLSTCAGT